ncbi:MAG: hypothetical protein ACE5KP_01750 [Dehalococcoidales bacterium]
MGIFSIGSTVIGLLLIIVGGIGLFFSFTHFALDSPHLIQGALTYGTFTSVGLAILIILIIAGPELE